MKRIDLLFALSISLGTISGGVAIVAWFNGDPSVGVISTLMTLPHIFAITALAIHTLVQPLDDASLRDIVKAIVSAALLWISGLILILFKDEAPRIFEGILNAIFGLAALSGLRDTITALLIPRNQSETSVKQVRLLGIKQVDAKKTAAIKRLIQPLPDWKPATESNPGV